MATHEATQHKENNSHTLFPSTEMNLSYPSLYSMLKAFLSYTWLIFLAHKKGSSLKNNPIKQVSLQTFLSRLRTDSYQLNWKDPLFWEHLCDFLLIIHHLGANMASISSNNKFWNYDNIWLLVHPKELCAYRKIPHLWGYLFCSAWRGEASWRPAAPHRECGPALSSALRWQQQGLRELHGAASGEGQVGLGTDSAPEGCGYSTKPAGIQKAFG